MFFAYSETDGDTEKSNGITPDDRTGTNNNTVEMHSAGRVLLLPFTRLREKVGSGWPKLFQVESNSTISHSTATSFFFCCCCGISGQEPAMNVGWR